MKIRIGVGSLQFSRKLVAVLAVALAASCTGSEPTDFANNGAPAEGSGGGAQVSSGTATDGGASGLADSKEPPKDCSTQKCPGPGRCYYVATTGDDAKNPGTKVQPFRTIQHALDIATKPGDTVYVRAGTYPENVTMRDSGLPGMPITLRNYPGERPKLYSVKLWDRKAYYDFDGTLYTPHPVAIGWLVLEGLEITTDGSRDGESGVYFWNVHDTIIRNNYIHDIGTHAMAGNAHRLRIEGNVFANIGFVPDDCQKPCLSYLIYGTGSHYTFVNNVIYGVVGYGLHARGERWDKYPSYMSAPASAGPEFSYANDWIVANNVFAFHQFASAMVAWAGNLGGGQATGWIIENNIFYKNCNGGQDNPFYNASNCSVNGISLYAGSHTINNNVFYAPGRQAIYSRFGTSYTQSGNIYNFDPLFANPTPSRFGVPSVPDFHLLAGSPAIDKGKSLPGLLTADFVGVPRPQGVGYDIGPYEFGGVPSCP